MTIKNWISCMLSMLIIGCIGCLGQQNLSVDSLVRAIFNEDVQLREGQQSVVDNQRRQESKALSKEFDYINPKCTDDVPNFREFKISGGQQAEASRWPYLISLQLEISPSKYRHFCAGVLVSRSGIVTTAHCIKQFRPNLSSDRGNLSVPIYAAFAPQCRHMQGDQERVLVQEYRVHQRYKESDVGNDIAVLKLSVAANDSIVPVDFRTAASFKRLGQYGKVHVVGWGSTSLSDVSQKRFNRRVEPLHHARLDIYDYDMCQTDLIKSGATRVQIDRNTMLCAYSVKSDTCDGDSGGPLIVSDVLGDPKHDILVGLTSWGPDIICGGSLYLPGIYTKISSYVQWISQSLKQLKATDADAYDQQLKEQQQQNTPLPFIKFNTNGLQIGTFGDEDDGDEREGVPAHLFNVPNDPNASKLSGLTSDGQGIPEQDESTNKDNIGEKIDSDNFKEELILACRVKALAMGTPLSDCG